MGDERAGRATGELFRRRAWLLRSAMIAVMGKGGMGCWGDSEGQVD